MHYNGGMANPEWAEHIVANAHADTAAMGLLIAGEAQRTRRVQLEAARRQVEATARQTSAIEETAQQTQEAIAAAADRQVEAQQATAGAIGDLGASVDAMADRMVDSLGQGFLEVQGTVVEGFGILERKLGVLAGITGGGFELVGQRLVDQTAMLGDIAAMTASPLATAAAEHYRRGVSSLKQGWIDEAVLELEQAIEKDRTNPAPHYALGVAQAALNEPGRAFAALALAVKYSTADASWGSLAASAAILQRSVSSPDQADEVARTIDLALAVAPDCAELLLTRAAHRGTPEDLVGVFTLAPELALVAIQGGIPGAEEAAEAAYGESDGPVHARLEIQRLVAESQDDGFGPNAVPRTVPQAMVGFPSWVAGALVTIANHARRGIPAQIKDAEADVTVARSSLHLARLTLEATREALVEGDRVSREAAALVEQKRQAVIAYESLPTATASVENPAGVKGGFRPFVAPVVLFVVMLIIGNAAGSTAQPFAAFLWIVTLVLLVVFVTRLVKAARRYGELRATAAREADIAQKLREVLASIAHEQAYGALLDARRELEHAQSAQRTVEKRIESQRSELAEQEVDILLHEAEYEVAQEHHSELVRYAEQFQKPILELIPLTDVARTYPLGDGPEYHAADVAGRAS